MEKREVGKKVDDISSMLFNTWANKPFQKLHDCIKNAII